MRTLLGDGPFNYLLAFTEYKVPDSLKNQRVGPPFAVEFDQIKELFGGRGTHCNFPNMYLKKSLNRRIQHQSLGGRA